METGILNQAMNDTTDDIVALEDKSTSVLLDTILQIDAEFMTVIDPNDLNNLKVIRGSGGTVSAHEVGATVSIGVELPVVPIPPPLFAYTMAWTDASGVAYPASYWVIEGQIRIAVPSGYVTMTPTGYRDQAAYEEVPRLANIGVADVTIPLSDFQAILAPNQAAIGAQILTSLQNNQPMFKNLKQA